MKTGYAMGTCPECGGEILNYETLEVCGECIYYPFTCEECGAKGKEWYTIDYCYTETD